MAPLISAPPKRETGVTSPRATNNKIAHLAQLTPNFHSTRYTILKQLEKKIREIKTEDMKTMLLLLGSILANSRAKRMPQRHAIELER